MAVESVAVADRKKVQALDAVEIRCEDKAVLILLIWIPWNEPHSSSEGKLGNDIVSAVVSLLVAR